MSTIFDELLKLELALLDPVKRGDPSAIAHLFTEDFVEFGRSGRTYNKAEIMATISSPAAIAAFEIPEVKDFRARVLASNCALVTYRTIRPGTSSSLRSSIWVRNESGWQICFHQGTGVPLTT